MAKDGKPDVLMKKIGFAPLDIFIREF